MNFAKAVDGLRGMTREEIAAGLDCSLSSFRQAKLDESATGYRSPPPGWQEKVAGMAERETNRLQRLAQALRTKSGK